MSAVRPAQVPVVRPVVVGMAVHQADALRLLTHIEPDCNPDVPDVWWWRRENDVCVWAEGWPSALSMPMLSVPAWEALDAGQGQWWIMSNEDQPEAVFQLNAERRLALS
jgi:hypothetical protein